MRESAEMYLETIYLLQNSHGHAHGVDIAKQLGVSKASVTKAMKKLLIEGFINKEDYGSITLTEKGERVSKDVYSKHKIISTYLKHSLEISDKEASENACKMEHTVSDQLVESMKSYLHKNKIKYGN